MNNQVKLIEADKVLSWLSGRMSGTGSDDKYYAYESVQEAIESGEFDPDTPPVPTIKPGDKVRYKSTDLGIGEVMSISMTGVRANVQFPSIYRSCETELLEVVE